MLDLLGVAGGVTLEKSSAEQERPYPNTPSEKVRQLQRKLWVCAKQSRTRRFHPLYDRIYRSDVLREAWRRVRSNRGAARMDAETIQAIEQRGENEFSGGDRSGSASGPISTATGEARYIPKADGKQRRLGFRRCGIEWCRERRRS